ncbi:gp086 [Rhodococcus phage ReqiPoco6]|uniref:Gp086 n=1 Tax=Rhodococcus phage ReqiPoco6 TaxID=691964 RepID=D4P7V4_9CAUD|nr:gp086 [Rhodococcus phage ReqiPoco6]ADD81084.1 gp086 [Rhodococcus phage ReqiPoco6]
MMAIRPRHPDKLYFESMSVEDIMHYRWVLKSTHNEDELPLVTTPFAYTSKESAIHNGVVLFGCLIDKGIIDVADDHIREELLEVCRLNPELTKG